MLYQKIIRPLFFRIDPEIVHDAVVAAGRLLGSNPLTRAGVRALCSFDDPVLHTRVLGMYFQNPFGLSAGFDKNGVLTNILPEVGFGFMEVGSVTLHPSRGNAGRHLVRLPKDKSIIVYYGLKNVGSARVLARLAKKNFSFPVGINIAKTNRDDIRGDASLEDFVRGYETLSPHFTYTTINVSCPNVQDGCSFQDPEMLSQLLARLAVLPKRGPVFLKLGNDHTFASVNDVLAVVERFPALVDGFVLTNLAKDRTRLNLVSNHKQLALLPHGGLSGAPIQKQANALLRHVYKQTRGKYVLIGVGGIFSAADAYERIRNGASLVAFITGLIYGGPGVVKKMKKELAALLRRDGFSHVADAVGIDVK